MSLPAGFADAVISWLRTYHSEQVERILQFNDYTMIEDQCGEGTCGYAQAYIDIVYLNEDGGTGTHTYRGSFHSLIEQLTWGIGNDQWEDWADEQA